MYDVTRPETFESLGDIWMREVGGAASWQCRLLWAMRTGRRLLHLFIGHTYPSLCCWPAPPEACVACSCQR